METLIKSTMKVWVYGFVFILLFFTLATPAVAYMFSFPKVEAVIMFMNGVCQSSLSWTLIVTCVTGGIFWERNKKS